MYHTVFNSLLELELKFADIDLINKSETTCPMTLEKENAYVMLQDMFSSEVRDKIIKSNAKNKEELIFFLFRILWG